VQPFGLCQHRISWALPRRYLYANLALSCDSKEYQTTQATAFAMLALWPVGAPLLYAALLWASRDALRTGTPTSLIRATAFLSDDFCYSYRLPLGWWEPLEMCRKLTLTGWVLPDPRRRRARGSVQATATVRCSVEYGVLEISL
jgi:hypothetical protein